MEIKHVIIGLRLAVCLLKVITAGASAEKSLMKCSLQSTPRLPVFSTDGDFFIGGVFSIHYKLHKETYNYLDKPGTLRCTGRFVRSGRNEG